MISAWNAAQTSIPIFLKKKPIAYVLEKFFYFSRILQQICYKLEIACVGHSNISKNRKHKKLTRRVDSFPSTFKYGWIRITISRHFARIHEAVFGLLMWQIIEGLTGVFYIVFAKNSHKFRTFKRKFSKPSIVRHFSRVGSSNWRIFEKSQELRIFFRNYSLCFRYTKKKFSKLSIIRHSISRQHSSFGRPILQKVEMQILQGKAGAWFLFWKKFYCT